MVWRNTTRAQRVRPLLAAVAATVLLAVLAPVAGTPAGAAGGGTVDLSGAVVAPWSVRPGVQIATVTGAGAHVPLTLVDTSNERLLTLITDDAGQANFAYVPDDYITFQTGNNATLPTTDGKTLRPGTYRIVDESKDPMEASAPFTVIDVDDHPPTSLYDGQSFGPGFHYVEMRDGVELSIMVRFPPASLYPQNKPFPTVIEYSGYGPSNPDSPEPGTRIANLLGFATVGINMRGSGCSGGVFDIFSPAQYADGYDAIEAIARQPWVLNNKVGMVGLSYSGISQLYVASTQPPSLAAITPLSTIEDPWYEQWPGGIYNQGFTKEWLAERDKQNAPNGTNWVSKRINGGDASCAAHQSLRGQNPDFEAFGRALEFRPQDTDARKLSYLVRKIDVPVYLTGAWQDEQTGSRFAIMLDEFDQAPVKRFTMFNGRHPDGYTPLVLSRWYEFLQMYVGQKVPKVPPLVRAYAPIAFKDEFKAPNLGFEPDRFLPAYDGDYDGARAAYEAEPEVRVIFESGAGDKTTPGSPKGTFATTFAAWPPPNTTEKTFYLGAGGTLTETPPTATNVADRFEFDPDAGPQSYSTTGASDFLYPQIKVDWKDFDEGKGLSYVSEPFTADTVIAGFGHLDTWLRSTAVDADLEVLVSEIYPDGNEVWIQNGLVRAGDRAIDEAASGGGFIEHYYDEAHYEELPADQFVNFQIPLFSVAHPIRKGSRLRVMISTPGRDMPLWKFENRAYGDGTVFHDVERDAEHATKLVLPIVGGINVPAARPPCNALRGQVCRPYVARANAAAPMPEEPTTTTGDPGTTVTSVDPSSTVTTADPSTTIAPTSSSQPGSSAPTTAAALPAVVVATPRFTG